MTKLLVKVYIAESSTNYCTYISSYRVCVNREYKYLHQRAIFRANYTILTSRMNAMSKLRLRRFCCGSSTSCNDGAILLLSWSNYALWLHRKTSFSRRKLISKVSCRSLQFDIRVRLAPMLASRLTEDVTLFHAGRIYGPPQCYQIMLM